MPRTDSKRKRPGRPPSKKPKGIEKPEKKKKSSIRKALLRSKKVGGRRRSTLEDNTNSDNSDSNAIFKEIDWEENFEVEENSLLDEFAPKPILGMEADPDKPSTSGVKIEKTEKQTPAPTTSKIKTKVRTAPVRTRRDPNATPVRSARRRKTNDDVKEKPDKTPKLEPLVNQEAKKPTEIKKSTSITVETDPDKFSSGMLIYVMDYGTSTWYKATVIEVDVDEEEVLVHYEDLSLSDEWVSMNSQRLSSTPPSPDPSPELKEVKPETEVTLEKVESTSEPVYSEPEEPPPPPPPPPAPEVVPSTPVTPKPVSRARSKKRKRETPIERTAKKTKRKKAPNEGASKARTMASSRPGRFEIGEKVLAKWSDHRMQKFPAVVKNISLDGRYDVLFYDGFEKTIAETDLSKATDEEIEKYRYATPSEADSLIMVDNIVSKEERRQRKKKTFSGDFFFESDFSKSKKRPSLFKIDGDFEKPIPPPPVVVPPPVPSEPSTSAVIAPAGRKTTPQAVLRKPTKAPTIRKPSIAIRKGLKGKSRSIYGRPLTNQEKYARKKARILERKEKERQEREMMMMSGQTQGAAESKQHSILPDGMQTPVKMKAESEAAEGKTSTSLSSPQDNSTLSPEHTLSAETSDESGSELTPSRKIPVNQLRLDGERWIGDIPNHVYPIKITGIDGVVRKSVIVPDKHLPPGWIKHAVTIKTGGNWEAFLISPEGYKIHSNEELRGYFRDIPRRDPPPELDFDLYTRALPELAIKQKELAPRGKFKRMKHVKKKRILLADSSCPMPTSQTGRVKTLLPKQRPAPPVAHPTPTLPPVPAESENRKCPACDKNFRKENLLQMHINHQHAELKSLVGAAPKVADLALARSLSAYSEITGIPEPYKVPQTPGKSRLTEKHFGLDETSSPRSPLTPLPSRDYGSDEYGRRPREEKKSTIRTILPLRQPMDLGPRASMDSDEPDSEAEAGYYDKLPYMKRDHMPRIRGGRRLRPLGFFEDLSPREPFPSMRTMKKKNPIIDKLQIATDSNDSFTEEEKPSPTMDHGEEVKLEKLKSEEIINCTCGFKEEDGLMIQCDICLCWQHGLCYGIEREDQVPEKYVCFICKNPNLVNSSRKFNYAHHYLVQGKLPSFSFRSHKMGEVEAKENILKKCFELSANVRQILNVERGIRVKLNIAEQPDHPKLYLWAKSWDDTEDKKRRDEDVKTTSQIATSQVPACNAPPEPEEKIDLEECRLRLLDHIEHEQAQIEQRLSTLEAQVAALEAEDPDLALDEGDENYSVTKQTMQMLLRDLSTVRKLAHIN